MVESRTHAYEPTINITEVDSPPLESQQQDRGRGIVERWRGREVFDGRGRSRGQTEWRRHREERVERDKEQRTNRSSGTTRTEVVELWRRGLYKPKISLNKENQV